MTEFLVQNRRFIEIVELSIYLYALKPLLPQFQKFLAILTFAITNNWCKQIGTCAFLDRHYTVNHILDLLGFDWQPGRGAVGYAHPRKQKPHIVVDFGHRSDRGARIFRCGFLFDRNCWAQPGNMVDIRFFHHIEELPRISG